MSKKITGKYICKDCNKEFEWQYIIPNKISDSIYKVHKLSENVVGIRVLETDENKFPIAAIAYCPECGFPNQLNSDDLKEFNN
ncbi:hypothetical protein HPJ92_01785 [Anoxybacillus flavithermus]|uniref:hypothetical protein n=1 Tax=Anoxybacillus flavithermus TaxID=33934 RepID=UPI00186798E1|nr:hypothetical protein [Anoxybacillus flavithermus]MBE2931289.1 hypothetical protein [Anoxybacillus flavithermus]